MTMNSKYSTSKAKSLARALTLRCPLCGGKKIGKKFLGLKSHCPTCDHKFEVEAGYFTGALAINMILSGGFFTIAFVIIMIKTIPHIPVANTLIILVPCMTILPIVFYPFSKTIWIAIDQVFLENKG